MIKNQKKDWGCHSVVVCMLNAADALGSIPSMQKKKTKKDFLKSQNNTFLQWKIILKLKILKNTLA